MKDFSRFLSSEASEKCLIIIFNMQTNESQTFANHPKIMKNLEFPRLKKSH